MDNMMALVDMKHTPEDIKEEKAEYASPPIYTPPAYPYGLCISLGEDELEKLGLGSCECSPGDGLQFIAMAKVTSASKREMSDGKTDSRVELQITHIALGPLHDEEEDET